jgi:hypothetical protein
MQLNTLRQQDEKTLQDQRAAASTKLKESSQRYQDALAKISKLDGHQTVLKVEVARLRLQVFLTFFSSVHTHTQHTHTHTCGLHVHILCALFGM